MYGLDLIDFANAEMLSWESLWHNHYQLFFVNVMSGMKDAEAAMNTIACLRLSYSSSTPIAKRQSEGRINEIRIIACLERLFTRHTFSVASLQLPFPATAVANSLRGYCFMTFSECAKWCLVIMSDFCFLSIFRMLKCSSERLRIALVESLKNRSGQDVDVGGEVCSRTCILSDIISMRTPDEKLTTDC